MLLDNVSSIEMLDLFLNSRISLILRQLSSFSTSTESVSEHFRRFIHTFSSTLKQIANIFLPQEDSQQQQTRGSDLALIKQNIPPYTTTSTNNNINTSCSLFESCLELLQKRTLISCQTPQSLDGSNFNLSSGLYSEKTNVHLIFRHLPASVQHYTPILNTANSTKSKSQLNKALILEKSQSWLTLLLQEAHSEIGKVLVHVTSALNLSNVRKEVLIAISLVEEEDSSSPIVQLTTGENGSAATSTAPPPSKANSSLNVVPQTLRRKASAILQQSQLPSRVFTTFGWKDVKKNEESGRVQLAHHRPTPFF